TRGGGTARVPVALGSLVDEVLLMMATRLGERGLVAVSETTSGLPPVPGDPVALRQVLVNLLSNGIDASARGGRIVVRAAWSVDGDGVELVVRDTGCGLTSDDVRRIFEPFYTTKSPDRGTGLGLAIV